VNVVRERSFKMRELTKSLFSFSWAMSLFGVQQMVNLTDPAKAAQSFDAVAGAAAESFEGVAKSAFQTGDRLQRQVVDAALGMFARDSFEPSHLLRTASDTLRQSAEAVSQGFQEATAKMQACAQEQGWGPMGGATNHAAPPPPPPPQQPPAQPPRPAPAQGWGPMPGAANVRS
jgi:hypothetical protein